MPENNKTDYNRILEWVSQGIPVDSASKRPKPDGRKDYIQPREQGEKEEVQPVVGLPEQSETVIPPKSAEFGKRKRKTRGDYDGHFFNRWISLIGSRYISQQTPIAGSCESST